MKTPRFANFRPSQRCFDDTAEKIFAGSLDNTVRVWDCRTRSETELYVLEGHADSVTGLDLSPDGEKLISNSMDKTVRMWDVRPFAVNLRRETQGSENWGKNGDRSG